MRVLRWDVPVNDEVAQIGAGRVVHCAMRDRHHGEQVVEVWTLESDTDEEIIGHRDVRVFGTGHSIPDRWTVFHVGSVVSPSEVFVWHVFSDSLAHG